MKARVTVAAVATAVVAVGSGQAALAAAPGNDTLANATAVAVGFSEEVDTREATTDADDQGVLQAAHDVGCVPPATNGTVWYTFTAPAGVDGFVFDVSRSDYSAGAIIVEKDSAGNWVFVNCGPGSIGTPVTEGTTYWIMAFSDVGTVTGGTLRVDVQAAAIPEIDLTVNPRGKVDRDGNALLSGSYTCTDGDFVFVDTFLKQSVGRFAISGFGGIYEELTCDGAPHAWTSLVVPDNGKFAGGKAASFTFAFTCGSLSCAESYAEQTVQLSKGR